jgi:hypothetical protein
MLNAGLHGILLVDLSIKLLSSFIMPWELVMFG